MEKHVLGLLGGLGVGAAIHYYRELAAEHDRRGLEMRLVMVHASIARTTDGAARDDRQGLAAYLAGLLAQLQAAGATVGILPALTPHFCIDELVKVAPIPVIDLTRALADTLGRRDGAEAIVLAGTDFAVMFDESTTPFPHVDCTRAHVNFIMQTYAGQGASPPGPA